MKEQMGETADYSEPILLDSLSQYEEQEEANWLKDRKLLKVHIDNFSNELVDQEVSSSWIGKVDFSPKVVGNLMALQDRAL